ncbi:MAG: hypothetical protein JO099_05930 [Acidobacteriia bacterium]|nr:hypothetical protein [Terriglobia bacterium]
MLEALELALGARERALETLLGLPDAVQQDNLLARALGLVVEIGFSHLNAHEFPLGNDHLQ